MTGLHFVLLTSPAVTSAAGSLKLLYSEAYVPFVARNPFAAREGRISNPGFVKQTDRIVLEGILSAQFADPSKSS